MDQFQVTANWYRDYCRYVSVPNDVNIGDRIHKKKSYTRIPFSKFEEVYLDL